MNSFFEKIFRKLKSIKHIEIIVAILFGIILLTLYLTTINNGNAYKESSGTGYAYEIESRMETVLSQIDGAGEVQVMVMLEEGAELDSDIVPKVSSVIVVAGGAKDYKVKLEILKACEALLNLPTANIEILVGK